MSNRTWIVAALASVALGGCLRTPSFGNCHEDIDCTANGITGYCESGGCSVDDAACTGSGHRYVPASGGQCVGPPDAALADGPADGPPDGMTSTGRECVKGGKRAPDSACAATVCGIEPRCCDEQWDATCVRLVETACQIPCSTMVFVGGTYGRVFRTDTWDVIWDDTLTSGDNTTEAGFWADYDNDGDVDLATVGDYRFGVYRNDGWNGTKLDLVPVYAKAWVQLGNNQNFSGRTGAWVDFDGDGDLDLSVGGFDGLVTIENQGGVFLNERVVLASPASGDADATTERASVAAIGWGDVDGDHDLDLIAGREFSPAYLFLNDGHGVLTKQAWVGPYGAEAVQFCNLDTDAAPEVVISGNTYLSLFELTGGTIQPDADATHVQTSDWLVETRCGDLDGDGDLDLFASGWVKPARAYRNGSQTLAGVTQAWVGTGPVSQWGMDLGDLDGDHKLDAIAGGDNFSAPLLIQVYRNTSTGGQNITFDTEAPRGGAIDEVSHDVELAPLPAMH